MPLVLGGVQWLLPDIAPCWYTDNLPAMSLESCDHLHVALAGALDSSEAELHLQVKSLLLNMDVNTAYTSIGASIDCLFIWLASWAFSQHLNIVHGDRIWTTRRSVILDLCDPVLVLTLTGYLFGLSVERAKEQERESVDLVWLLPTDGLPDMLPFPFVLNQPAKDLQEQCREMDLVPDGSLELIHDLLQGLMGGPYCEALVTWLLEYKHLFGPVSKWLSARGLDFNDYAAHLRDGGP